MSSTVQARDQLIEGDIGRALAEMEFGSPPAVTRALAEALDREELGYLGAGEIRRLQDAVGRWLRESYGWTPPADAIRPVSDLVAGFRAILTHFVPENEPIIVPTPGYMPFLSVPPMIGRPVIEVPMIRTATGWSYDFDGLRAAFASGARLLVLCNPHNPIGKVATDRELAEIEQIVDEFDGLVLSDEIHAPLVLGSAPHIVYAARSPRAAGHTITATSASKAFNIPGTKCGQLIFTNPDHLANWNEVGHWYEHQTSVLGVVATEAAYRDGRAWLDETVEALRQSVAEALSVLDAAADRTGIRVLRPEATYLLWIDLRESGLLREGVSAAQALREASQLVVTDGSDCGEAGRGFVRFNAALPREHVREAMERLIGAAEESR
ncbi:MalY/PatB family protein [Leucobacter celer]|uniref:MalY/PatB family protein n=1 Tax=Leucobacter celer TaxID=668625 RepID=UPI0006A7A233|nr:aminotransferase class I/II-fold pyridoxal phosphate-dependent enzyme [Leucobacter celer]